MNAGAEPEALCAAALPVLLFSALGCSEITGVGEYAVGDDPASDASTRVENSCLQNEVYTSEGACASVGVPEEVCDRQGFAVDPDGACRAVTPEKDCESELAYPGTVRCDMPVISCSAEGYPLAPNNSVYVNASATDACEPRGTKECPFSSIGAALVAVEGTLAPVVLVHDGTYAEDVVIRTSGLTLTGCGDAQIIGQAEFLDAAHPCYPIGYTFQRGAAVCIGRDVRGVTIQGVRVTSSVGLGVMVLGGELTLRSTEIADTASYGVNVLEAKVDDALEPNMIDASATLDHVAVVRAAGVGIHVVGATVSLVQSSVQGTVPLNVAPEGAFGSEDERIGLARGVALYAGHWTRNYPEASPADFAQSRATIERSAITGNAEIGIFVTGAHLDLTDSLVGALPEGAPSGLGIVVERSIAVGTAASAVVERSVIDRTRDAAIDVRDANVTVRDTTIRDTVGRLRDGCTGQGLRVRSLPTDDGRSEVTVERTSILNSGQAAVFAASSTVHMTETLLRNMSSQGTEAPCARVMGDGIDLESYADQPPAELVLDRVRVEGAERAALVASATEVTITSSNFACSRSELVESMGREAVSPSGALCGCGTEWRPCSYEARVLPSWAAAGASAAWPDRTVTRVVCPREFQDALKPLEGATVWSFGEPEVMPALVESDGCARLAGLSTEPTTLTIWKPGFSSWAITGFSGPNYTDYHRGGPADLALNYALTNWPVGVPLMMIGDAPDGSTIRTESPHTVVSWLGDVIADGVLRDADDAVPNSGRIELAFVAVDQPGWQSVVLTPPPGVTCGPLGNDAPPGVQYIRLEQGLFQNVVYSHCR